MFDAIKSLKPYVTGWSTLLSNIMDVEDSFASVNEIEQLGFFQQYPAPPPSPSSIITPHPSIPCTLPFCMSVFVKKLDMTANEMQFVPEMLFKRRSLRQMRTNCSLSLGNESASKVCF
jgi:hypothetical protein